MADRRLPAVVRRLLPGARPAPVSPVETKVVLADYYSALASSGLSGGYQARPWPVERAVTEAYERLVYVFKAVEAIAGNASRLPFRLKQGEKELDEHPLYRVLNQQANPLESGRQFRKRLSAQVLLSKRGAFVEVTRNRAGDVIRLDLLPPTRTRPVPGTGGTLIDHFEVLRVDGTRVELPPEQVRWFREPHPLDPFCGVTPLEAAGLSAELDLFSRVYNVQFLRHDARPGGILAVDGEMEESEMDRVEGRFGAGPVEAGKLTVIAGKVSYVDLAARPRDMAYETTAAIAKQEILTAFGVGESVIGNASGRSWDNAEQELHNFWTITMPPHLDLLLTGLDEDSTDDLEGFFDTSGVEVLQKPETAKREEARAEFEAGLISPDEYRERAGLEPFGLPETRALYLPAGKTVVATSEEDAEALAEKAEPPVPEEGPDGAVGQAEPGEDAEEATAADGGDGAVVEKVLPFQRRLAIAPATKTAGWVESTVDEAELAKFEAALTATLTSTLVRLVQRTAARVESPKQRKGTRHWEARPGEPVETKGFDVGRVIDAARWATEVGEAVWSVIRSYARAAAGTLLKDLSFPDSDLSDRAADLAAEDTSRWVADMVGRFVDRLTGTVSAADLDGEAADTIADLVRGRSEEAARLAGRLAETAATSATGQARDAAATLLDERDPGRDVLRQWRSRRNEKTRDSHRDAHGQHRALRSPFLVGGALLNYPGDPGGPPGEVLNCKCVLNYRAKATGRYVSRPQEKAVS